MAKVTTTGPDLAGNVDSGSFTSVANGDWVQLFGRALFWLSGTFVGTFRLEASFDGGTTVVPVTAQGAVVQFTAPVVEAIDGVEDGVLVRAVCSAYTSGTAGWRISR